MAIEGIKPASQQDVNVYMPYYQGDNKRRALPYAIGLYKQGNLEGERQIEGSDSIVFLATWNISMLPADLTRCRMQFDGNAELSYEMTLATFEFVDYLITAVTAMSHKKTPDFSKVFYRKLLRIDE
ncbi:hypothetical protein IQ241_02410 [Romeria aff. gracilis LEGE 07310]|uniref:Uncharacterized protein n=1 Tax=Vasconcelosia minhoensis LEGE 07310 TaxID=915328 RepID=A0A8J7AL59_9CYAN|nr:type IV pilus biogenesis protein EbsA [Romeria gracilis]MBE9076156.1 hypothetical protein [Romeria aff. gracilis LEGE 07310]